MKFLLATLSVVFTVIVGVFCFSYFSSRPALTIDPATLAGDGSRLNYCELPVLDGSGKLAAEIPKGNTPGCSYDHFPLPVLRECTERLPEGASPTWIAFAHFRMRIRNRSRAVAD